jgi:hypothetical protein
MWFVRRANHISVKNLAQIRASGATQSGEKEVGKKKMQNCVRFAA